MRAIVFSTVIAMVLTPAVEAGAEPRLPEKVQVVLESWLTERAPVEKATGIAAYVSFGDPGPAIEAFAGKVGRLPNEAPVSQDTLFQMGSTSKSFAVSSRTSASMRASWRTGSIESGPIVTASGTSRSETDPRRRAARMRASSSAMPNGLVT